MPVDREKNQIDVEKLDKLILKAETKAIEGSEFFDFRENNNPQKINFNTNLNKMGNNNKIFQR